MVHDLSRRSIKRFGEPAVFTYFSYKVSSVKLAAYLLQQKLSQVSSNFTAATCSSNFSTAKAVKLTAILLSALELNLLQQNTLKFAAAKLVKLAAFCYVQRKTVKKAAISLVANIFVEDCFGFNLGDIA